MSTAVLLATHATCLVVGFLTCRGLTLLAAARLTERNAAVTEPSTEGPRGPRGEQGPRGEPGPPRPSRWASARRFFTPAAVAVLAGLVFVGLGAQQTAFQRDRAEHDECVSQWGKDLTETLDTRLKAGDKVAKQAKNRDEALRALVTTIARIVTQPPEAVNADLLEARVRYAVAQERYDNALANQAETRAANPYPTLDCED